MSLATTEETPDKHYDSKIRASYLVISVDKHQWSIMGATPENRRLGQKKNGDYPDNPHS
jgi:hypothetical protein